MRRFRLFIFIVGMLLIISSSCRTQIKLGYRNLKSGNWEKDTTHISFTQLPSEVINAYDKYFDKRIEADTQHIKKLPKHKWIEFSKEEIYVHYVDSDKDSLLKYVNYSNDYSIEDRWGPMGLYINVANRKYIVKYHQLSGPLILYENILYYPAGIFLSEEDKEKYENKNFIGYNRMYYVAHKLDWLERKMSKKK